MLMTSIQITMRGNFGTKLRATVSITLDDTIAIHDIKVLDKSGSFFLAMPSRVTKTGTFKDIAHPINRDTRKAFERLIIYAYEEACRLGCTKMEMKIQPNAIGNLLSQTGEMFAITSLNSSFDTNQSGNANSSEYQSMPLQEGKRTSLTKTDDDLIKWLES